MAMLKGKKALIMGVANAKSIAWGIAEALHKEGAELGFTFVGESIEKRVRPLAEGIGASLVLPCDAGSDEDIAKLFEDVKKQWGDFDILIHAMAFANKDELKGEFIDTSRDGFKLAMDISAYSLVGICQKARPIMNEGGSVITLTYLGAERVIKNYNVMGVAKAALETSVKYLAPDLGAHGIRINAISAGPIKTLAAMGISGFRDILNVVEEKSPMQRNVTPKDIGGTALYLASDLASGVTGDVIYVDSGFSIMGL